jgi:6,7-dimethyl-8-ribityllumazine synthase
VSKKAVDSLGLIIAGGTTRDDQVSAGVSVGCGEMTAFASV